MSDTSPTPLARPRDGQAPHLGALIDTWGSRSRAGAQASVRSSAGTRPSGMAPRRVTVGGPSSSGPSPAAVPDVVPAVAAMPSPAPPAASAAAPATAAAAAVAVAAAVGDGACPDTRSRPSATAAVGATSPSPAGLSPTTCGTASPASLAPPTARGTAATPASLAPPTSRGAATSSPRSSRTTPRTRSTNTPVPLTAKRWLPPPTGAPRGWKGWLWP